MVSWKHRKDNGAIIDVVASIADVGGDLEAFERLIDFLENRYPPNVDDEQ